MDKLGLWGHLNISKSFGSGDSVAVKVGSAIVMILLLEVGKTWFRF
jgi:hypothetical protein